MIETNIVKYTCDCCGKIGHGDSPDTLPANWTKGTEVGDLCPVCSNSWEQFKESFKQRMKQ